MSAATTRASRRPSPAAAEPAPHVLVVVDGAGPPRPATPAEATQAATVLAETCWTVPADGPVRRTGGGAGAGARRPTLAPKAGGPCDHCGCTESPQWRRGPAAKPVLCNACGTRYRRTNSLTPAAPAPAAGTKGGAWKISSVAIEA